MSAWPAVALVWLAGWGIARWHRRLPGAPGLTAGGLLWGVLLAIVWLGLLDVVGVRWTPAWLLLPVPVCIVAGLLAPRRDGGPEPDTRRWASAAGVAAAAHAALVAATPAFGWDFRYIWGLKATVFAAAGRHDLAWLAWPSHLFTNPDYPPLWPDLLAAGVVAGGSPGWVASAWQAALVLAIAAACWEAAKTAPPPVRALAAAAGAWAPVIFTPSVAYSGYAEPLLAFAACTALGALPRLTRGASGAVVTVAVACAVMALTKNEGMALAFAVAIAAWRSTAPRSSAGVAAATLAAVVAWRGVLLLHGIHGVRQIVAPGRMLSRLVHLPDATVVTPVLAGVIAVWLLALFSLWRPGFAGVRIAIAVWGVLVVLAYLTSPYDLAWHLATSLDRVIAAPLPAAVALALGSRTPEREGERPPP